MATAAFDPLASAYDRDFSDTAIGRWLRDRTNHWMERLFAPGMRVLDLGCGTGEDALWLARRDVEVLATDASAAMLEQTQAKTQAVDSVAVALLDLNDLTDDMVGPFDGVLANFGVLNCVLDRPLLAAWLAKGTKPGARLAFSVMGPVCAWEIGWHGLHGAFGRATRRMHGATSFQPKGSDAALVVDYPSARTLAREFAPHFRVRSIRGLGLFLPPSDVFGVIEQRSRVLHVLTALEHLWSGNRAAALLADHYWVEMVRA